MTRTVAAAPAARLEDRQARDVMSRHVVTLGPLATVEQALAAMHDAGVRHLPVVLEGCLVGLVDDRVVALAQLADGAPSGRRVFTLMTPDVPRVAPDAGLPHVARLVDTSPCDAVVVMVGGALLGIVTATDLVRALAEPGATAVPEARPPVSPPRTPAGAVPAAAS